MSVGKFYKRFVLLIFSLFSPNQRHKSPKLRLISKRKAQPHRSTRRTGADWRLSKRSCSPTNHPVLLLNVLPHRSFRAHKDRESYYKVCRVLTLPLNSCNLYSIKWSNSYWRVSLKIFQTDCRLIDRESAGYKLIEYFSRKIWIWLTSNRYIDNRGYHIGFWFFFPAVFCSLYFCYWWNVYF